MSLSEIIEPDRKWMRQAMREAEKALERDEVPVGAIVVHRNTVVGRGHNMVEQLGDPTAHAEMIAITAACETLGSKHLADCTLYVSLEPCPMCAGAAVLARIPRLVFAAQDEKTGAVSSLYNITQDPRLNHTIEVIQGVEESYSEELLDAFFRALREREG